MAESVAKIALSKSQAKLLKELLFIAISHAGLWRALVFGDAEGIKQHAAAMNAADSYAFFASMLTMRPWEEITK